MNKTLVIVIMVIYVMVVIYGSGNGSRMVIGGSIKVVTLVATMTMTASVFELLCQRGRAYLFKTKFQNKNMDMKNIFRLYKVGSPFRGGREPMGPTA